jgi:3-deoxy-manno-octulosonate cytidylyltransferase (CMP-KDO synthetase)
MQTLIVVPARYASTRLPGKPLALIAGRTMLERVAVRARAAARALPEAAYVIATDDRRIADHCAGLGLSCVMTDPALPSGSDRALAAADALGASPAVIVNLQGDAPFTPVDYITAIVQRLASGNDDAATPVIRLTWEALDALRAAKQTTPFSGTTAVMGEGGQALWFSKSILPLMRKEERLRAQGPLSPVLRHVGLYAFRRAALERFCVLPPSTYEQLEGLEQLRLLENGLSIACVPVEASAINTSGIDSEEDRLRAEAMVLAHGDPDSAYFR